MAKLSRWKQLIFGKTGATAEFGKIGSDTVGSPENTKDPAAIQSLAGYLSGLFAITNSGVQAPRLEDLNALFFIITSQLAYLMEAGTPEWLATQEYWIGSRARIGQKVYMSLTGEDEAPNVGNNPASDAINWRDLDAYYRDAANLLGTLPLARLPTVLTGKKASTAEVADKAIKLLTAITIGGVSFDGTAPINLPGVNVAGNQNTSGNAATATNATNATNASYAVTKLISSNDTSIATTSFVHSFIDSKSLYHYQMKINNPDANHTYTINGVNVGQIVFFQGIIYDIDDSGDWSRFLSPANGTYAILVGLYRKYLDGTGAQGFSSDTTGWPSINKPLVTPSTELCRVTYTPPSAVFDSIEIFWVAVRVS